MAKLPHQQPHVPGVMLVGVEAVKELYANQRFHTLPRERVGGEGMAGEVMECGFHQELEGQFGEETWGTNLKQPGGQASSSFFVGYSQFDIAMVWLAQL